MKRRWKRSLTRSRKQIGAAKTRRRCWVSVTKRCCTKCASSTSIPAVARVQRQRKPRAKPQRRKPPRKNWEQKKPQRKNPLQPFAVPSGAAINRRNQQTAAVPALKIGEVGSRFLVPVILKIRHILGKRTSPTTVAKSCISRAHSAK